MEKQTKDTELRDLKRRKEDFRIEIRKHRQDKTLQASRLKHISNLLGGQKNASIIENSSNTNSIQENIPAWISQLLELLSTPENSIANQHSQLSKQHNPVLDILSQNLSNFDGLFARAQTDSIVCKQLADNNIELRLLNTLRVLLSDQLHESMQLNPQAAQVVLSKLFQFIVTLCLHSETALKQCLDNHALDYFLNVMISAKFFAEKSNIVLYAASALDLIASSGSYDQLLVQKEASSQLLALLRDINLLVKKENSGFKDFERRILIHAASTVASMSKESEIIKESDKKELLSVCQELLEKVCKEINQSVVLQQFFQNLPEKKTNGVAEFDEEEDEKSMEIQQTSVSMQQQPLLIGNITPPLDPQVYAQRVFEELLSIEGNLCSVILNEMEKLESDELEEYMSENITFLVFVISQIPEPSQHYADHSISLRIQSYGEILNALLLGDDQLVQLAIENFEALDYIRNLLFSTQSNLIITGLACLYNLLVSATDEQMELITEHDLQQLMYIITSCKDSSVGMQTDSIKALSAYVDKADTQVVLDTLENTNIVNVLLQRMDAENDSKVVSAAISLLESLFHSGERHAENEDDEEVDEEVDEDEEGIDGELQKKINKNYWTRKFVQNPASLRQIDKIMASNNQPREVIFQLEAVVEDYLN